MRLITARHITEWATTSSRDCQELLPLLIRRLVRATAGNIESIDFPAGDSISDEGWDGRLTCKSSSPFVPDGKSGWEIGTDKSANGKADSDYEKRSSNPLDLDPTDTSFVFVTPRAWPKKHSWSQARRSTGPWKDVRVIAAGDLEQWLEDAPAVALWLANHLGIAPSSGFRGLDDWWQEWAVATEPATTFGMLLGGREGECTKVSEWLAAPANSLEIQGDAPDEGIAFLRAVASKCPEDVCEAILARCVVAQSEAAFSDAAAWSHPLIIVAPAESAQAAGGRAINNGHHLLLIVGRTLASRGGGPTRLPRLDRHALETAFTEANLPREEAVRVVAECGRSIAVFRRSRSRIKSFREPAWATQDQARHLIPALLAGAWSEALRPEAEIFGVRPNQRIDRQVLCRLAGTEDYEVVRSSAGRLCINDDPPLQRAAEIWRLTAPLDAWYLLGARVTTHDLERLADSALSVLSVVDPKYDLPDDQQWSAGIYGKERPHSGWLREGLAISLAIVAHHGETLRLPVPYGTAPIFVAALVRKLFGQALTWQSWASLSDVLPVLAEAAPDAFLSAIETFVANRTGEAVTLLTDGGRGSPSGECRHAGLLWALERLAWHPKYLARCCVGLAHLDEIDPGGRWGNRPFASLCEIIVGPGDPYTFGSAKDCLGAFDALIAALPDTAWRLLLTAAEPLRGRTVRDPPIYMFAQPDGWEPWSPEERGLFWNGLADRLLQLVQVGKPAYMLDALHHLQGFPESVQLALARWLNQQELDSEPGGDISLWTAIRFTLHRVRSELGMPVNLPPAVERALENAFIRLTPREPTAQVEWLFSSRDAQLPDGRKKDWHEYERILTLRRAEAASLLLDGMAPEELANWAISLPDQYVFGHTLASVASVDADRNIAIPLLSTAADSAGSAPPLILGYAVRRISDHGVAWLDTWLEVAGSAKEPSAAMAALLCALPNNRQTWQRVDSHGADVSKQYWRWNQGILEQGSGNDELAEMVEQLLAIPRLQIALKAVVYCQSEPLPGALLLRLGHALLQYLASPEATPNGHWSYEIEQLLERIDIAGDVALPDVAALEWPLLDLLVHTKRGSAALHKLLASDPANFIQILCWAWKRSNEEPGQDDDEPSMTEEQRSIRANRSYILLDSWKSTLPGQDSSGIDRGVLSDWISDVRRLARIAGRSAVADSRIGRMLAYSPNDSDDGAWPHIAVRQVLEQVRSDELDAGFTLGVRNSRGVTWRGMRDGGAQERTLAERYEAWAAIMRATAPYTARLLDQIAEYYRADARREDAQADLNDLR